MRLFRVLFAALLLPLLLVALAVRPAAAEAGAGGAAAEPAEAIAAQTPAAQAEELYFASTIASLQETRARLRERAASGVPRDVDAAYDEAVTAIDEGAARLRAALAAGVDPAEIDALAAEVEALNALRIELLASTSEAKRERLLGLSQEGIGQLLHEIRHLALVAEWYPMSRLRQLERLPALLEDVGAVGALGWIVLQMLAATLLALWIHRRHRDWIQAVRQWLLSDPRHRALRRGAARALGHLAALATELIVLVWLHVLRNLAGEVAPQEIHLLGAVAIAWAWYRLARAALYRVIASAAMRSADLHAEHRRRVLRSLDLVGRYVLGVVIFLLLSAKILGRGYLHHVVIDFAWIGALPIGIALVRGWQDEIAGAWIGDHPTGALSAWLERTRGTPRGVVPALVAVGSVVARGTGRWLRERALRFDQTRSALAWLFRRRLERHAETVGRGVTEVQSLPAALRDAFAEEAVRDPALAIDHWPRLAEVEAIARRLAAGGHGSSVAVVGERGAGKTSWLHQLATRVEGLEVARHAFPARLTAPDALHRALAQALGVEARDEATLVAALREGPPRLVLLDGCEHLVLRRVGGLAAAESLLQLAGRTGNRVLWVCAFGRHAFDYLRSLFRGEAFAEVVQLAPWSEEQIGRLLDRRMEAARCTAIWDDLLEERLDGGTLETEVLRTSERYRRLLWDHAGGNPRVALHYWLRSLVPDRGNRVRVRLFEAPPDAPLEALTDDGRFLLASVVLHGTLTAAEAAETLREPATTCEIRLAALEREGFLHSEAGRYAVTTRWYREVIRHLRRKHLLVA